MYDKNLAHYVTVTGIIVKDSKFLIVKRAPWEKAFPNQWTVPGGKLKVLDYALREKDTKDHWYNIFENLLRQEVKEETNLEINKIGYLTSMIYIRPDKIPTIIVSLFAQPTTEGVKLCSALTDFAWVSLEEAKNYELIEGIYEELEMLDRHIKGQDMSQWTKSK